MLFKIYTKERQLNSKGKCLMWTFLQKTVQDLTRKNAAKKPRELNSWLWVLKSTLPQRQLHIFSFFHRKLFQPFWQWIRNKNHLLKKKKHDQKTLPYSPPPKKPKHTSSKKPVCLCLGYITRDLCVYFQKMKCKLLECFWFIRLMSDSCLAVLSVFSLFFHKYCAMHSI